MKIDQSKITIQAIDLNGLKIQDASKIKSIRVKVEASHSGLLNKNHFLYVPTAMRDGAESFVGNPVIYGHNEDNLKDVSKHLGYIDDAKYVHYEEYGHDVLAFDDIDDIISILEEVEVRKLYDSEFNYKGLGHIELVATITKPDAIKKILDQEYSDVQIGGDAKNVYCSICNSNLSKSKHICHKRGRVYDDVQCYWIGDQITYEELSFVDTPADPHVKTTVLKDQTSDYDNGKIKILDFVLHDTEENPVKKIKSTEFMQEANKLMAIRLQELGIQDSAEYNADAYAKLKDSDFLFAGDKVLPIHDAAHLLIAQEIVESIDNEGIAVADQVNADQLKVVLTKRNKRIFKTEQVNLADEFQKIADSVKNTKVEDTVTNVKEFDSTKLSFKHGEESYDGKKLTDMDESDIAELREQLPCDEWGVWDLRCALSSMISATMSVDKMAEVVKGALSELFPGGTAKVQDSYMGKRLGALEDEVEAYEAETLSLKEKLKKSLVHNILVAEGKLQDDGYKTKLMSREIVSLEDKLTDLTPEALVAEAEAVAESIINGNNPVDITDGAAQNTDNQEESEVTVTVQDSEQPASTEGGEMSAVKVRDEYKKILRTEGLTSASKYMKDIKQKGLLPKHFKL